MKLTQEEKDIRVQCGDGKFPNKYWVTISEDITCHYNGEIVSLNDVVKTKYKNKVKSKLIGTFKEFKFAKQLMSSLCLGDSYKGVIMNRITIEDRLGGVVYEAYNIVDLHSGKSSYEEIDESKYSLEMEKKCNAEKFIHNI